MACTTTNWVFSNDNKPYPRPEAPDELRREDRLTHGKCSIQKNSGNTRVSVTSSDWQTEHTGRWICTRANPYSIVPSAATNMPSKVGCWYLTMHSRAQRAVGIKCLASPGKQKMYHCLPSHCAITKNPQAPFTSLDEKPDGREGYKVWNKNLILPWGAVGRLGHQPGNISLHWALSQAAAWLPPCL